MTSVDDKESLMPEYNAQNMPHVKATLNSAHKIIYKDENTLIIYNEKADTYIAEGVTDTIINKIKKLKIERLETSNKDVFDYFYATANFKYHQICLQCYHKRIKGKATGLDLPTSAEVEWIARTYGTEISDIEAMRENNEIFVYRKNGKAVSYVGIHIDGSVGFLYTKPEYRQQGYATKIENELFKMKKEPIFSQILEDNEASVAMHKKNGWKFNRYKIYWLFNKSF